MLRPPSLLMFTQGPALRLELLIPGVIVPTVPEG
jgi:hypothetical protein